MYPTYADYYSGSMGSLYKPPVQGAVPSYGYGAQGAQHVSIPSRSGSNYYPMPQQPATPTYSGLYRQVRDPSGKVLGVTRNMPQAGQNITTGYMMPRPQLSQSWNAPQLDGRYPGYGYGGMGHGTLGPQYASAPQYGGEYMQVKDANGKVIGIRRRQQQVPPQYGMLPRPGQPQPPQYSNPAYYTTDV